jgi:Uncharacterised protein family UPF0547
VRTDERTLETRLAAARQALERDKPTLALRNAWTGGQIAARLNDTRGLETAIEVAKEIRERTDGRDRADAETLVRYCSHCLVDAEAGVRRSASPFARFLRVGPSRPVKPCPDCAENIHAAAKVCRFCGYRFE